jgi:hypothetical protein
MLAIFIRLNWTVWAGYSSLDALEEQGGAFTRHPHRAARRRRPVGAIIADICRDLGIVPSNPLWRELSRGIIENGGNLATLFKDTCKRLSTWLTNQPPLRSPRHNAGPAHGCPAALIRRPAHRQASRC